MRKAMMLGLVLVATQASAEDQKAAETRVVAPAVKQPKWLFKFVNQTNNEVKFFELSKDGDIGLDPVGCHVKFRGDESVEVTCALVSGDTTAGAMFFSRPCRADGETPSSAEVAGNIFLETPAKPKKPGVKMLFGVSGNCMRY